METQIAPASEENIRAAKELLQHHHVVAFPTETVYGLGGNALSSRAVQEIFRAKGRPSDNPLIVHVSSMDMLKALIAPRDLPVAYRDILAAFWPGPLTILLPRPPCIPSEVTAGQDTVAVRMPSHPLALALIDACGFPLAAPSANTSGRPSPTRAIHVYDDLKGRIPLVLDGGSCDSGVESTVLDALRSPPCILRPGGVTFEMLAPYLDGLQVYKRDFVDASLEQAPTTPGMKYRHYSPNARVVLIENSGHGTEQQMDALQREYRALSGPDEVIGVLLAQDDPLPPCYPIQMALGASAKQVAHTLFQRLREMEDLGVTCILVQGVVEDNEGLAVMNRLRKAASQIVT
ncbi:hypothetical protein HDU91_001145 [Kappamyces sp. JEL0680]|nr:hypothetical protein HDU91_001145 [Kappamyces sp. JEL0680]